MKDNISAEYAVTVWIQIAEEGGEFGQSIF